MHISKYIEQQKVERHEAVIYLGLALSGLVLGLIFSYMAEYGKAIECSSLGLLFGMAVATIRKWIKVLA